MSRFVLSACLSVADTLADNSTNGETLSMPSSVARCSPSTLTGKMTTSLRCRIADSVDDVEPVVSIVAAVFHLCSAEIAAVDAGLGDHLSPQVSRSLARVLCRWTCSYLFPDLSCYDQLSSELGVTLSHGPDVDICWTATYLLKYVIQCIKTRSSESALTDDVLGLFAGLVDTKERYVALFHIIVLLLSWPYLVIAICSQMSAVVRCQCNIIVTRSAWLLSLKVTQLPLPSTLLSFSPI